MAFLLDTNVCIGAMKNHSLIQRRQAAHDPSDCFISSITIYELHTGIERCNDPAKERRRVETFLAPLPIVSFEHDAAIMAARVRRQLEMVGQIIGPYDLMIAGHALALGLTLVTHNTDEFKRVAGLALEDWQV